MIYKHKRAYSTLGIKHECTLITKAKAYHAELLKRVKK